MLLILLIFLLKINLITLNLKNIIEDLDFNLKFRDLYHFYDLPKKRKKVYKIIENKNFKDNYIQNNMTIGNEIEKLNEIYTNTINIYNITRSKANQFFGLISYLTNFVLFCCNILKILYKVFLITIFLPLRNLLVYLYNNYLNEIINFNAINKLLDKLINYFNSEDLKNKKESNTSLSSAVKDWIGNKTVLVRDSDGFINIYGNSTIFRGWNNSEIHPYTWLDLKNFFNFNKNNGGNN